jgi:hypothetical protein
MSIGKGRIKSDLTAGIGVAISDMSLTPANGDRLTRMAEATVPQPCRGSVQRGEGSAGRIDRLARLVADCESKHGPSWTGCQLGGGGRW